MYCSCGCRGEGREGKGGREGGGQLLGQSQRSVSKRDLDPHPHIHSVLTISVQPLTPTGHLRLRLWVVEIITIFGGYSVRYSTGEWHLQVRCRGIISFIGEWNRDRQRDGERDREGMGTGREMGTGSGERETGTGRGKVLD